MSVDEGVLGGCGKVEAVRQPGELFAHHLNQFRVVVAQCQHAGTGEKVDEDVTVDVSDEATGCILDGDRQMSGVGTGAGLPALLPTEQLGFGGYNSIRGYDLYALAADSGYFVNLELWSPSYSLFRNDELRFLAFYDYGDAYNHSVPPGGYR